MIDYNADAVGKAIRDIQTNSHIDCCCYDIDIVGMLTLLKHYREELEYFAKLPDSYPIKAVKSIARKTLEGRNEL